MGLFKRVSDNIRANLNSLLDKAEDPEKMLDQYLRDMEEDIADAEGAVARQLAVACKSQYNDLLFVDGNGCGYNYGYGSLGRNL